MTVRYRDWWGNIGTAVAVVLVAGVFGVAMWTGSGEGGPVIGWITAPGAVILVAILVVRCLRRGVDVDDDGVTKRDPWATTFVPWCAVRDLEFRNEYDATFVLDDRRRVFVSAPITRGAPSLREAYDDVRRRWSADMGRGNTYPRPGRRFVTLGFWIAALALVLGAGVWDDARFHADVVRSARPTRAPGNRSRHPRARRGARWRRRRSELQDPRRSAPADPGRPHGAHRSETER